MVPRTTMSRSGNEITIPSSAVTSALAPQAICAARPNTKLPSAIGNHASSSETISAASPSGSSGNMIASAAPLLSPRRERLDVHGAVQGEDPPDAGEHEAEAQRQPRPRARDAREQRPLRIAGQPRVDDADRRRARTRRRSARGCPSSARYPARSR